MKVEIRECQTKISAGCTGTFQRIPARGRPSVSCPPCREAKDQAVKPRISSANPIDSETQERICGCGQTFKVKPGRGRKAEKCDDCRKAGTVYRRNDDGDLEAIRAEQVRREEQNRRNEAGATRAMLLHMDMQKLFKRRGIHL